MGKIKEIWNIFSKEIEKASDSFNFGQQGAVKEPPLSENAKIHINQ